MIPNKTPAQIEHDKNVSLFEDYVKELKNKTPAQIEEHVFRRKNSIGHPFTEAEVLEAAARVVLAQQAEPSLLPPSRRS